MLFYFPFGLREYKNIEKKREFQHLSLVLPPILTSSMTLNKLNIIRLASEMESKIDLLKTSGQRIGFVPTMGALHMGHISLINRALSECDVVICSLFVNPTQFNDPKDLEKYPRTEKEDIELLEKAGCHFIFIPTVEEVYPSHIIKKNFDFSTLDSVMEGRFRPGHFNGVGMVVNRFFEIIQPNKAYFGLKDYQQFCIIKSLVKQTNLPIEIIGVETMREKDGLAMSSRNQLLSKEARSEAPLLYHLLNEIKQNYLNLSIEQLKKHFEEGLSKNSHFKLDYFEIADGDTLAPLTEKNAKNPRAFVAAFIDNVRLIDNISLIN